MIEKIKINDITRCPVGWAQKLDAFQNGKEYVFKPGVNIVVGENGSGKSTLLEMLRRYLVVDYKECGCGSYNSNITKVSSKGKIDGVDVYADYVKNTFRLCHAGEIDNDEDIMSSHETLGTVMAQKSSSTGEGVLVAINSLFRIMFSSDAKLTFDYDKFEGSKFYQDYFDYVKAHRVETEDEWTILMDEPDRNLSIDNIDQIRSILSFHKPQTQVISVIHNPLLIYSLSKDESINFIEFTDGYVKKVVDTVGRIVKS